jgi:hypothetical protein
MPTTVFIWNNNMVSSMFGGGHKTVGHASVHITSVWTPPANRSDADSLADQTASYVSWWPGSNSAGMRLAKARSNLFADIIGESNYAPDHIIRIEDLDETAMATEWAAIRGKENAHYRLNVKNCSTVAARVLRAGVSWKETNVWYAHSPLWTPLKVKRLAFSMGGKEKSWTSLVSEMFEGGAISASSHTSYGKFKKRSSRHGNSKTPSRFTTDAPHGLARWYK